MTQRDITAFLEHHGVKGMRWGVRRKRSSSFSSGSSQTQTGGKPESPNPQKSGRFPPSQKGGSSSGGQMLEPRIANTKHVNLSTEELKARVNRMQLEKQYNQLEKEVLPKKAKSKGREIAENIIADVAKTQATNLLNKQLGGILDDAMKKTVVNKAKNLSDSELEKRLRRADLERKYNSL